MSDISYQELIAVKKKQYGTISIIFSTYVYINMKMISYSENNLKCSGFKSKENCVADAWKASSLCLYQFTVFSL